MISLRGPAAMLATAALAGGLASPAHAADSVTVQAEVSAASPCLVTSEATLDFGSNLFSPDGDDETVSSRPISYTSCSGLPERVFARATDATSTDGTTTWSLAPGRQRCPAFGLNNYLLQVSIGELRTPVTLGRSDQELETVGPGQNGTMQDAWLIMPCVGSDGAGDTMSFQIIFTAAF